MLRTLKKSLETVKTTSTTAQNHTHTLTRILPVPTPIAYAVVADVAKYHEFIPYCTHSFINKRDLNGEPSLAGLRVGFQNFDEQFECDLECIKDEKVLATATINPQSLFHHLHTKWSFNQHHKFNDKCSVTLELSYKFKSPLYHSVSGVFGPSVSELVMKAFDKRARELSK